MAVVAGIRVVVCLPAAAAGDLRGAIGVALAPFRLGEVPRWRGIWDEWTVRGGSDGTGFTALPGHADDPRLIHDDDGYDGTPLPSPPGRCAGGPRGLLDLAAFRLRARWQPDLLTLDGWWIEDGRHPRHSSCAGEESCPHLATGERYVRDFYGHLEAQPADTLLVALKCHG
ncbi:MULTISPECIES: hypothetical protein [Streptomycetaceae]|uniref:hypothetical protein n=1 Tax=Streptomycetaceae TaxID=2062 RepID=UPI003009A1BA